MHRNTTFVIPGRDEVASPESILPVFVSSANSVVTNVTTGRMDSGPALRASRNDEGL
jgi:hypothetical protein